MRIQNDITRPILERIMCRVRKDKATGCWNWTGATVIAGGGIKRPRMNYQGRQRFVYSVMYELHFGPLPKGKFPCHDCDNGLCVNPFHLFAGNIKINADDMIAKGRAAWQKNPEAYSALRAQCSLKNEYRNKTGFRGVSQTRSGKFAARIVRNQICTRLGVFATPEEASAAWVEANLAALDKLTKVSVDKKQSTD